MSEQQKRRPGRPRTVDRDAIAHRAMQVYWAHGVFELSLNEVCKRCGVSKPALYRAFGGEDQLMEAALAAYRTARSLPLLAALERDVSFGEALDAAVAFLTQNDGTPAGCLFTHMRTTRGRLGPHATRAVRVLTGEHDAAYYAFFERACARGEANAVLQPGFAARYIDTQFATILVRMGLGHAPDEIRAQALLALGPLRAS